MLHRAINYIIERFGYFWCFTALITEHTKKVTKTLNKVINSSMKHNVDGIRQNIVPSAARQKGLSSCVHQKHVFRDNRICRV